MPRELFRVQLEDAGGARHQANALSSMTDSPQTTTQLQGGTGLEKVMGAGGQGDANYDAGWGQRVMRLLGPLYPDLKVEDLQDPETQKWANRKLRKLRGQQPSTGGPEPPAQAATGGASPPVQTGGPEPSLAAQGRALPSVLSPGRLPTGRIWESEHAPVPGGYMPAGNGLYWPPWPTTGGTVAQPMSAAQQATALAPWRQQQPKRVKNAGQPTQGGAGETLPYETGATS